MELLLSSIGYTLSRRTGHSQWGSSILNGQTIKIAYTSVPLGFTKIPKGAVTTSYRALRTIQVSSNTLLTDSIPFLPRAYVGKRLVPKVSLGQGGWPGVPVNSVLKLAPWSLVHVNECEREDSQAKQVQTLISVRKGKSNSHKIIYHACSLAVAIPTADLTGSNNPEWQVVARCIKNSSEESVQATEKTLNAPATNRQETSKKKSPRKGLSRKSLETKHRQMQTRHPGRWSSEDLTGADHTWRGRPARFVAGGARSDRKRRIKRVDLGQSSPALRAKPFPAVKSPLHYFSNYARHKFDVKISSSSC